MEGDVILVCVVCVVGIMRTLLDRDTRSIYEKFIASRGRDFPLPAFAITCHAIMEEICLSQNDDRVPRTTAVCLNLSQYWLLTLVTIKMSCWKTGKGCKEKASWYRSLIVLFYSHCFVWYHLQSRHSLRKILDKSFFYHTTLCPVLSRQKLNKGN